MKRHQSSYTFIVLLLCLSYIASAQIPPGSVDSVRIYLDQCKAGKPDAEGYDRAKWHLEISEWKSNSIDSLLDVINSHTHGKEREELNTLHMYLIRSLFFTDFNEAIQQGLDLYNKVRDGRSIPLRAIRYELISGLRVPFRNGPRNMEGLVFFNDELKNLLQNRDSLGIVNAYFSLSSLYRGIGLSNQSIYCLQKAQSYLDTANKEKFGLNKGLMYESDIEQWIRYQGLIGEIYSAKGDYQTAVKYLSNALAAAKKYSGETAVEKNRWRMTALINAYLGLGMIDSAQYLLSEMKATYASINGTRYEAALQQIWTIFFTKTGQYAKADSVLAMLDTAIQKNKLEVYSPVGILKPDHYRALNYMAQGRDKEAEAALKRNAERVRPLRLDYLENLRLLATLYRRMGEFENASSCYTSYLALQDSLLADQARTSTISFETEQQIAAKEFSIAKLENENKLSSTTRNYSIAMSVLLIIGAISIFTRYRNQRRMNTALEKTMEELKSTQAQLIHSEKMASLGELTAGIAHEIQNPLNFVNNFAEVNTELNAEGQEAIGRKDWEDAEEIMNTLAENNVKILHHGKRADAIVKGMLQHSRTSSGVKESTDINALVDEFLRLAYHGMSAKNDSFKASFTKDLDNTIDKINLMPQDIGRVLLNLFNNAFYAVSEKSKTAGPDYLPTVKVATRKTNNGTEISVADNGNGIPQSIKDKIFQPFFTTKPTGEGTGLGLSLSYDIVKAHGGELKVETIEWEGSRFIIQLPD